MDPNSVLKLVREQRRQINDKFIKPSDQHASAAEMVEYKPNMFSQLSPQQQQQIQYQQQIRQQYEAMASSMRQPSPSMASHAAAAAAAAMMNSQKKMMDEIYSSMPVTRNKNVEVKTEAGHMAAPGSAFQDSKAFFYNGANGEYNEAQYLANQQQQQQRMLKSNMDMYQKMNGINSSPINAATAAMNQQQKLNAAYSLEFHKKPNSHFNKPAFYDANQAAASLAAQQQQQQLNSNSADHRNKLYKPKSNIPMNDFYLNTNGGHLPAPGATNPANGGNQQLTYNLQNASQIDALTRSASVKSAASDSGIGSSSPLSDCSDYGNGNGQNMAPNSQMKQQAAGYQQSNGGSLMAPHHKMPYPKPADIDQLKGFNKVKRSYPDEEAYAQMNAGHHSPKLNTINNGSIVVPKPVMVAPMGASVRPKSNETPLEPGQMPSSAQMMPSFGPGRKRKNQPNIYDDLILANANRVNQQKMLNGKHENKDDALATAAVAAAAAVLGYTSTMAQASSAAKQGLELAKPKPMTPQSSPFYPNANIVPAFSGMMPSAITKQVNPALQSPYMTKSPADLNNNMAGKYACTDRCCSGANNCGQPPSHHSSPRLASSAAIYHPDKAAAAAFKSQSPMHPGAYMGHEYPGSLSDMEKYHQSKAIMSKSAHMSYAPHLGSPPAVSNTPKHDSMTTKRHSISIDNMSLSTVHEKLKEQQQQQPYCDCADCNYLTAAAAGQNYLAAAAAAAAATMMGKSADGQERHNASPYHLPKPSPIPSPHLSSKSPQLRNESLPPPPPSHSTKQLAASNRPEFASPRPDMLGAAHSSSLKHAQAYPGQYAHNGAMDQALLQQKLPCPCKDCYNALKLKQQQQQMSYHPQQMSPGMRSPSQGHMSASPNGCSIVKPKPISLSSSSSNLLESYLKDANFASHKRSLTPGTAFSAPGAGLNVVSSALNGPMPSKTLAKHMESFIDKAFRADKDSSNAYFDLNGAAGKVFTPKLQSSQYGDLVKDTGLAITKQKNSFFSAPSGNPETSGEEAGEAAENGRRRNSKGSCEALIVIDNDENDSASVRSAKSKRALDEQESGEAGTQQAAGSPSEYYSRANMNLLAQAKDQAPHRNSMTESPSPVNSPSTSPASSISSSASAKRLRRSVDGEDKPMSSLCADENEQTAASDESTAAAVAKEPSASPPVSQSSDDSSVSISKKTLPIVTSHIQDWLDKLLELSHKLSAKHNFTEIYEQLLKQSWSRLLLTYMIENSFQFFVTKDSATHPPSPMSLKSKILSEYEDSKSQESESSAKSSSSSDSGKSFAKEKEAVQLQNLINKGYNLGLKADEFELLREMILFKEGGEESKFSEACAQAQKSLQETIESNHGQQQFTKLLLFLPSIYNVKTEVIEALFCRHLNNFASGSEYVEKRVLEAKPGTGTPVNAES